MSAPSGQYFFISYSRADKVQQQKIVAELRKRGVNVWVDIENLVPGSPGWEREIEKSIRGASGVIVLLSPDSNNSEWVRREISFTEENKKSIFPILIHGDENDSIPLRLSSHQRVDLRHDFSSGLDQLADALKDHLGVTAVNKNIKVGTKKSTASPSTIDLKKLALPAAIVLIGLLCIGGIAVAINLISNRTVDVPITPTYALGQTDTPNPPAIDITITPTETEPVTNSEPTGKIVFTCQVSGLNDNELCIINADGSDWQQLTDSGYTSYYGSLSPDGQTILFANNQTGKMELYEIDLAGHTTQLTNFKGDLAAPEISPDNKYIAFTSHVDNLAQIWIMNRDGSNARKLYGSSGDALDPTWSPDGKQILFAVGAGENKQLYIMGFDGSNPYKVSNSIKTRGRSDWSSLGLLTYYTFGSWERQVMVINPDGSDMRQVTNGGNSQGPSFSPDGQWIAYTGYTNVASKDEESCEIFIVRVDGSDMRQLTDNSYCDYQPRWGN